MSEQDPMHANDADVIFSGLSTCPYHQHPINLSIYEQQCTIQGIYHLQIS